MRFQVSEHLSLSWPFNPVGCLGLAWCCFLQGQAYDEADDYGLSEKVRRCVAADTELTRCRRNADPIPNDENPALVMVHKTTAWVSEISATGSILRWRQHCMDAGLVKGEGFAVDASIIKADASRQRGVPGDEQVNWSDPALSSRVVREYLEALDEEALAETLPKRLSLTDPQARWTAAPGGPAFYAYSTNYLIDTEHGVIMDVEPTPAHRTAEVESTKTMIDRVEAQFDIKPDRLIGDTAYGTAPMLAWMVEEKNIKPHVPVWDKTERKNDSFSSNDFHWNEEAEEYRCPAGNVLRSEWRAFKNERSHVTKANTIIFRSRQTDCATCPMKAKCCPNTSIRKIVRSVHEAARDVARRIAVTPAYQRSRHERKKVEMLFAHLKRILKLDRLRLRGMSGATDEFTLAAAVQNLRRLAKFSSQGPPVTG